MPDCFETIIIGLGAMGSAAAYHLAKTGQKILGIDRFKPPHDLGSSHGLTRIIREAYFEDPLYVPLIRRAYELWDDLEKQSGRKLLLKTGGLMIGPADGELVKGAQRSAIEHNIPHEMITSAKLRNRFPIFRPPEDTVAIWEPRAGILFPETSIQTHLEFAAKNGATLLFDEPVLNWQPDGEGIVVFTKTSAYRASRLLLSAGAWTKSLLLELDIPLLVERQIPCWFEPVSNAEAFRPGNCLPVYVWQYEMASSFLQHS